MGQRLVKSARVRDACAALSFLQYSHPRGLSAALVTVNQNDSCFLAAVDSPACLLFLAVLAHHSFAGVGEVKQSGCFVPCPEEPQNLVTHLTLRFGNIPDLVYTMWLPA